MKQLYKMIRNKFNIEVSTFTKSEQQFCSGREMKLSPPTSHAIADDVAEASLTIAAQNNDSEE